MRGADAAAKGITSVSDLAARARRGERFRLICNTEFYIRPDGLMPLQRAYGFDFASVTGWIGIRSMTFCAPPATLTSASFSRPTDASPYSTFVCCATTVG